MKKVDSNPRFFHMSKYCLSPKKAQEIAIDTLSQCGISCPANGWDQAKIHWKDADGEIDYTFLQIVEEIRNKGVAARIQKCFDKSDPIFGGTFSPVCTPNYQLSFSISYAGWEQKVSGPCRCSSTEIDLTEDILYYRIRVCEHSDDYEFQLLTRFYRAYLSSCISIVESFINRHILLAEHENFSSPELDQLKKTTSLEERVKLWHKMCSDTDPTDFFNSIEWNHFQEIRKQRNEILHISDPEFVYSLKEIWEYLNKVQTGIGGLLFLMRKAHKKPTLYYIECLRNAPKINFSHIEFKTNGNHIIKVLND